MKKYLIGIDVGTTSVKTIICDSNNYEIVGSAKAEHSLLSPRPGWAEEDPKDWWNNVKHTISKCLNNTKISPNQIACIGITGMAPAFVLLDNNGQPLRTSIQQNDARTYKEIEYIKQKIDADEFFNITGCVINQQMIGPKILWIKGNQPDVFKKINKIMGSYDYIIYKLTGEYSVEHNWALEGGLYDIQKREWSDKLLEIVGIEKSYLPPVNKPDTIVGTVENKVAKEIGLEGGIPVIAGTTDSISSTFMAGIQDEGDLLLKFGGAGDILFSTDKLVADKRLFIDYHVIPKKFIINGCMASSGSVLKWFVNECFSNEEVDYKELDKKVEDITSGSDGIVVLPYFVGEKTPIFDLLSRGVIFGLTLHHTKYHLYHAILEAIGFGFLDHIKVFEELGFEPKNVIATNGGAISKIWGKIISNIIGYPIKYLSQNPGSSMGVAFMAGMAVGCFKNWSEAKNFYEISYTVYPEEKVHKKYTKYFKIYKKLYLNLKNVFVQLNDINKEGPF